MSIKEMWNYLIFQTKGYRQLGAAIVAGAVCGAGISYISLYPEKQKTASAAKNTRVQSGLPRFFCFFFCFPMRLLYHFFTVCAVFSKRSEFVSIISVPLSFVNLCPRKRIAPAPIL